MLKKADYKVVMQLLLDHAKPMEPESVSIAECAGRILAQELLAGADVPPFDRSAYDGYALRSEDICYASKASPVTLRILEEVAAGQVPTKVVTAGTATKILTGAPIPQGADCVIAFEKTQFDGGHVTLFSSLSAGNNIVRRGEDVRAGIRLADCGTRIDPGLAGTLAGQGISRPKVYRKPVIGLLSTGSELIPMDQPLTPGKIYNSNSHTLAAALNLLGCKTLDLGIAGDNVEAIAKLFRQGLDCCDAIISTGGVSVGDYDLTPAAMEAVGAEILAQGLWIKPGMASAFAVKDGKLMFGLSGNPASSLTAFYAVVQPVIRKMTGLHHFLPEEISVCLLDGFSKASRCTRLLRGKLVFENGRIGMQSLSSQGNAVISSAIGSNVMAIIPAGSGPVPPETQLSAFLL